MFLLVQISITPPHKDLFAVKYNKADAVNKQQLQKLWRPLISAISTTMMRGYRHFLFYDNSSLCVFRHRQTNHKQIAKTAPNYASNLVFEGMQTCLFLGTGGYQCRPIGPTHTHTARKSFGLVAAITVWLTGSPWVPNDPNKYILYACVFHLPGFFLPLILFSQFVPLHVSVDSGCLWAIINNYGCQVCSICLTMFLSFFFKCNCASTQVWEGYCLKMGGCCI